MRVALAQINACVGDLEGNVERCLSAVETARSQRAELVILPEMVIPGYPPRDILFDASFTAAVSEATADLARRVSAGPPVVAGTTLPSGRRLPHHPGLYNAAVLLNDGEVHTVAAKRLLPAYDVFFEPRWFLPGPSLPPTLIAGKRVGFLVCEDLWDEGYDIHPSAELLAAGAEVLVCLAASPYQRQIMEQRLYHARRQRCPVVYVNLCGGNDELIFDGRSFALNQNGDIILQLPGFEEAVCVFELDEEMKNVRSEPRSDSEVAFHGTPQAAYLTTNTLFSGEDELPPRSHALRGNEYLDALRLRWRKPNAERPICVPTHSASSGQARSIGTREGDGSPPDTEGELYQALVLGARDFVRKNRLERAFVGLSGGIDSALVAVIAAEALGPERVTAIAIPSRYTDPRSTACARELSRNLGIHFKVVELESLHAAAEETLTDLLNGGTTAENLQARLRAMILMGFVNRYGGILLNTSNKTELALGYATIYGDMAGALCPIADLTKPEVVALARWIDSRRSVIPSFILERPPSAELRPDQVDPFDYPKIAPTMETLVRENRSDRALRRSEHKRWQMGLVLKVSPKAFGSGRLIPITRR